jgi:acetyltransferase-like isoleucine patch superfamily enzyme
MKRAIIGAGGFAREVAACMGGIENIPFFVHDKFIDRLKNKNLNVFHLSSFDPSEFEVIVAIGNPVDRKSVVDSLPSGSRFFTYIHPTVQILSKDVQIGAGSIVCANCILTTNIVIGSHSHLNLSTTVGHDTIIGDYFTSAPGVHVSGNNKINNFVYMGTNSCTKQQITITSDVTIGMNAGVTSNIIESGTYIGTPARKVIKK